MSKLIKFPIEHFVIITILVIALAFFGIIAFNSLRQELFPDIFLPSLLIITTYPGASPTDVEKDVTTPIEDALSTLAGVDSIQSSSFDSLSFIEVGFSWGVDIDKKFPEVREKLNGISDILPENISGIPEILKMDPSKLPLITVILESSLNPEELTDFFEKQIRSRLARIDGVSELNLHGGEKKQVIITVKKDQLVSKHISILDIFQILKYYNISFPGGIIKYQGKDINIRSYGEFKSISDIENLVVGFSDNTFIRLKDVAKIEFALPKPTEYTSSLKKPVIVLDIMKQQGKDTLKTSKELIKQFKEIEKTYPGLIKFQIISNQGNDIKRSINTVRDSALMGGLLAILILFIFLRNIRATLVISFSIPLSILFTFIGMKVFGRSLNLMTLSGLTVGIGMVVDASIVVLENIDTHLKKGLSSKEASYVGTKEVSGAILASTTTSLAVFIPMIFIQGIAGLVLKDIALTISLALTGSLIVAVIFVPYAVSHFFPNYENIDSKVNSTKKMLNIFNKISNLIGKGLDLLTLFYKKVLEFALEERRFIITFSIVLLIISVITLDMVGFEFLSDSDMSEIEISISTPNGYSLERTREKVLMFEDIIKKYVPEVQTTYFLIGRGDSFGISSKPNIAYGKIRLVPVDKRNRSVFEIISFLQQKAESTVPDINITISNGGLGALASIALGGKGFMIEVYGTNFDSIYKSAKIIEQILSSDKAVLKTDLSVNFDSTELLSQMKLDTMGNLGLIPYEAAIAARIYFYGMEAGNFRTDNKTYPIFLKTDISDNKITSNILNEIFLKSRSGNFISYSSFAKLELRPSVSLINHRNRLKSIIVTAYLSDPDMRGIQKRITPLLKNLTLPLGVNWEIIGSAKEIKTSFQSLLVVLLIGVFLVYMVMVIQFERFSHPLIILLSIPFMLIGATLGIIIGKSTLSIVSFLGLITLAGTVVNNAIVLIDFIELNRKQYGKSLKDAIINAGSSRLRPILMTTLTTVLGVLPMALGIGEGANLYKPLGMVIAAGLTTSTLITLVLVPVIYFTFEKRKEINN
ncbi:MAG: efflux RND transporter permease subunit [Spirochaetales bacterium]|jgi:HAE1 family hydrophobic/amphiphilic exporter-1|nr:efflux RND transporter permease subunit [Exilispira sp.]NMC67322.1 efflux RND transporter permease subunit [Spirochaetales bacterium]